MTTRWGASAEDWAAWQRLGLTADLLPYVANPKAVIAPYSTMKRLGKTPALYDRHHQVHGFVKWQEHVASARDIERWSADGDYGICLQGRRIRAWDIDVPDPAKSKAIADAITDIGGALPVRSRSDSGKILLAFEIAGDWFKDVLPVDGGKLEFLAQGQQFLVTGRHEDGARYVWDGPSGLPSGFPVWTAETVREVKDALELVFGSEGWSAGGEGGRARLRSEDLDVEDEVATWLVESWETFGAQGEKLFVLCPWKDGHSLDSGETEASWLMRGTRGYERGHFKCLHASCASRGREEFLKAVGYTQSGFDVIEASNPGAAEADVLGRNEIIVTLPSLERKKHKGVDRPEATLANVLAVTRMPDAMGYHIGFDTFRSEMMMAPFGTKDWIALDDDDITDFREWLTMRHGFLQVPKETMRDAIGKVGKENQFDTAQMWLESLAPWDGVKRVDRFMADYMGCEDSAYTAAVGNYAWTAHVARIMDPGCKADMAPILVGRQGAGKSSGVGAISPSEEFFAEIGFHEKDADFSRMMRGTLVAEIAELRGLNSRDAQTIKANMSRRHEKWTPKFKEYKTTFPRRLIFWGTSNEDEILADTTGERRWLPVRLQRDIDVVRIETDRNQLWAEGLVLWRAGGIAWQLAEKLGALEHYKFKVVEPWEDMIRRWTDTPSFEGVIPRGGDGFTAEVVAREVLGLSMGAYGKKEEMKIAKVLADIGFVRAFRRIDGQAVRVWIDAATT